MSYDWTNVQSSNVSAVKYDDSSKELQIRFKNGSEYTYYGIIPSIGNSFPYLESKGRGVWQLLRNKGVPYSPS